MENDEINQFLKKEVCLLNNEIEGYEKSPKDKTKNNNNPNEENLQLFRTRINYQIFLFTLILCFQCQAYIHCRINLLKLDILQFSSIFIGSMVSCFLLKRNYYKKKYFLFDNEEKLRIIFAENLGEFCASCLFASFSFWIIYSCCDDIHKNINFGDNYFIFMCITIFTFFFNFILFTYLDFMNKKIFRKSDREPFTYNKEFCDYEFIYDKIEKLEDNFKIKKRNEIIYFEFGIYYKTKTLLMVIFSLMVLYFPNLKFLDQYLSIMMIIYLFWINLQKILYVLYYFYDEKPN